MNGYVHTPIAEKVVAVMLVRVNIPISQKMVEAVASVAAVVPDDVNIPIATIMADDVNIQIVMAMAGDAHTQIAVVMAMAGDAHTQIAVADDVYMKIVHYNILCESDYLEILLLDQLKLVYKYQIHLFYYFQNNL